MFFTKSPKFKKPPRSQNQLTARRFFILIGIKRKEIEKIEIKEPPYQKIRRMHGAADRA